MYEGYKVSDSLKEGVIEIVLEQYQDGYFERIECVQVPSSRIGREHRIALLQRLVCRFNGKTGLGFEQIVGASLNKRGKTPTASDPFQIVTAYPEPGVMRIYCGTNTKAWIDEVIDPSKFRK
jgi:hypothetical protein